MTGKTQHTRKKIIDACGMYLAGRHVKHITEATGLHPTSIKRFLRRHDHFIVPRRRAKPVVKK